MDHATIRLLLHSAGWKEKEVIEALASTSLEMPVPPPPDRGGAREAFLHLLSFAALCTSIIAVVVLLFQYVDRWFPDPALPVRAGIERLSTVRWFLAVAIVSFPVFVWLSRVLLGEIRTHPERAWSATRRWLTYVTLLFASLAVGGALITLVFGLLEGELSARFLLKVLAVLAVAGLTCIYYLLALRLAPKERGSTRLHRASASAAAAIVLPTIVWGFVVAGSPGTARVHKLDQRRLDDLRLIVREIQDACLGAARSLPVHQRRLERPLPATLEQLVARAARERPRIQDPETGHKYGYAILDQTRFELCATFRLPRDEKQAPSWNHPAGRHCFEFDVLRPRRPVAMQPGARPSASRP